MKNKFVLFTLAAAFAMQSIAQDKALDSNELAIIDAGGVLVPNAQDIENERERCDVAAKKARKKSFWASVMLGALDQVSSQSTTYFKYNIDGVKHTSSVTYTDPYKLARARQISAEGVNGIYINTMANDGCY